MNMLAWKVEEAHLQTITFNSINLKQGKYQLENDYEKSTTVITQ